MSSDHDKKAEHPKASGQPTSGQTTSAQPEAAVAEGPKPVADTERMHTLERENADLKDRLLRALAEMENLRRRTERELQDQRAYSITKFATDIVATADNLRRALESAPKAEEESEGEAHAAIKALIDGVELTERDLLKALERHGVKKRVPMGERFDPHRDQAMFEVPDETQLNGTVVQVVQAGYTIGERVLRPAMVGVSKGGPARAPVEAEASVEGAPASQTEAARPAADTVTKPRFDKKA